ncbi:SDR family NAD(P)-dependent oxidoreductase [Terriglobus sp. 2YAB30_2]|uniref:SDR family NAD(P)-dependent oxidoreductase n=1 Tax=Terriglobus sp. 2YAB30_2 TaxID=3233023 RepID=UPI003F9C948A
MDLKLKGKHALVTGGSAGIGLAIVKGLIAEGVRVTVPSRDEKKLKAALGELGAAVTTLVADAGTAEGAEAIIKAVPSTDILVNNLGIYEPKKFEDITDAEWFRLFEVNVMSGVRLARHYFPQMLQKNEGRILFISSESGIMTPGEMVHYGMTKSAQLAISRGMAEATRGTNVTVNTVMPGPTRSEGIVEFLQKMASKPNATPEEAEKEFFEKHRQSSLLQRLIDDTEVANLVVYLASPLSAATTGAAVRAEGGLLRSIY